jgi:integrase
MAKDGLKWIARNASRTPYWVASARAVALGFEPKSVNLGSIAHDPARLAARCESLQLDMNEWLSDAKHIERTYDGTFASALDIYRTDQDSPFRELAPSSRRLYGTYLRRLRDQIGAMRIDRATGRDIKAWHREWSSDGEHKGAGATVAAVLAAALSYGKTMRLRGCVDALEIMREMRFPGPAPRTAVATRAQVEAYIAAAHETGHPGLALAAAFQFEAYLRLWDAAGTWVPISDPRMSDVLHGGRKWLGLRWSDISPDFVLTYTPLKTAKKTGKTQRHDLTLCPLIMAEFTRQGATPGAPGPVVICRATGKPYTHSQIEHTPRRVATVAGWPAELWPRDLRASGITEARAAGAATDDLAKAAGHSTARTTATVYDRADLEAARRARKAIGENNG